MDMVIDLEKTLEQKIRLVRSAGRVTAQELVNQLFENVIELHGDHVNRDDAALFSGIGLFGQQPITILAVDRGKSIEERQRKNGGAVRAAGYRKALHALQLAEHFKRPVISFLNMPGADASMESENEGQSKMIADMIEAMGAATVPNLAIIVGEGHSGGALAFANANQIVMLENALFSVAAPEAMAAILRDNSLEEVVPMTASKLHKINLVDYVIAEDEALVANLRIILTNWMTEFSKMTPEQLLLQRVGKFQRVLDIWNTLE